MTKTDSAPRFGLRYFQSGEEVKLLQVSGGGRVLLRRGSRKWWGRPMLPALEVYETDDGATWPSRGEAQEIAARLTQT